MTTLCDDDALYEYAEKGVKFTSLDLMIQMEYCSGRSLSAYLDDESRVIDRKLNFNYFKMIISAVKHIH